MSKKMISALVAGCMCSGLIFSPVASAEVAKTKILPMPPSHINGDLSQAKFPLDQAIAKAKEVFNISASYEQFESGINTYDGRTEWHLNWTKNTEPRGNVSVRINAANGEIIGMDRWEDLSPGQKFSGLPQYSYDEGAKAAEAWVKKLLPNYMTQAKLVPTEDRPFYGFTERGPVEYYYNFARMVNGVSFPENNIHVRFNADTGQIMGFGLQWQDKLSFPSTAGKISTTQAEKVFGENVELVYFRPQMRGSKDTQVKLAYRIKKGSGLLIDAFKGEVINDSGYGFYDRAMGGAGSMDMAEKSAAPELSPVEQAEVDKYKNLLSAEKALAQVKKVIQIPTDLKQTESRLTQDYQYPEQKIWNFYWSGEKSTSYESMSVGVDAVTGELISFNKWVKPQYKEDQKPQLTQEQAQQKAAEFIKKNQSARFGQTRLSDSSINDYVEKGIPRSYLFTYERLVNNIPFANNGFDVQVDAFTGEIISYQMAWWNLTFPNPQGILDQPQAVAAFLSDGGLKLEYLRLQREKNDAQANLVYLLKNNNSSTMLDARTGQFLNWNGEPVPPKQTNVFTDIAGNPAENDINQLAKANIVKSIDGKFYPERNITKLEALEMLVASRGWYEPPYRILQGQEKDEQVKRVINAAISLGIIEPGEDKNLEQELSRLDLAKLLINTLDYDGAAKLAQIYQLATKDAGEVPAPLKGYAALSLGLGLQSDLQGKYAPAKLVTRAEAATNLVHMLQVKK